MLIRSFLESVLHKSKFLNNIFGVVPAVRMRNEPVIFVIGCTGTGKSDLGVAISKKYGGEVISVDSMQFYRGLDIATNKITDEEAEGIPHHMMSFLEPSSTQKYNVHQFKDRTLQLISEIVARNQIPVIVGGTTYYAESILYKDNVIDTADSDFESDSDEELDRMTTEELWKRLQDVDPESASLVHPNNRARVRRAVQIYKLTGKKKSEFIREQKHNEDVDLGGRLRFENSLVLYLDATPEVLEERLDSRVDKMLRLGLKQELVDYYAEHSVAIRENPFGVMQCIGLKEFVPWLEISEGARSSVEGETLFRKGCDDVKLHTRQYAKRQRKWYASRLLRRAGDNRSASTSTIDTSDKSKILENGLQVVDQWMGGTDFLPEVSESDHAKGDDVNRLFRCEVCDKVIAGKLGWENHLRGKPHRNQLRRSKRDANEEGAK